MKKILLISMAILTLSLMLFAQPANQKMMGKDDKMMMQNNDQNQMMMGKDMMKQLNLTEAQEKKIEALRDEQMKFMNTKQAELKNLKIDKQNAMMAEDYTKAKQVNKSISDLQLTLENAMVDHMSAVMKELTPEQKAKFKEMHKNGMMMNKMMNKKMMKNGNMMDNKSENCSGMCE